MKFSKKQLIYLIVGLILGIAIALIPAPSGLEVQAMRVIGILVCAIVWWAGQVFHEAVTAILMCVAFVIFGKVPIDVSFSAFSGSTYWLLVAAFGLGAAIKACGLLERIAIILLKLFPKSYRGQVIGLLAVTTITSPFVPSKAAKCTVLSPLTRGISEAMGYKNEGKEATGLFLAYYSAICFSPAMFITASVTTAALVGMYSAEIQAEYTMVKWALCSLPFIVPFFIGNYLYISNRYKPASGQKLDVSFLEERQKALGPWKREEKIMGVIMILTVLSWVLKSVTNIPEYATALIALCATLIFGILPVKQWRNNVAWESLIFIACSVGLGTVLPHVNITTWLSEAVGPYTVGFFSNPFLLIAGLAVLTLLVRFLILSEIGYLSVFTALLIPLGISAGINPWIIGFILNAFVIGWFLPYQSSVYLTAIYAAGEGWVTIKDTTKYCYVYCIIGLVCMYIAYFLWNLMGIWSIA